MNDNLTTAFDIYCALKGQIESDIFLDEPMSRHTSYMLGGKADLYIVCDSLHDLIETIKLLSDKGLQWAIVGKGSNLLVSDDGFRGAIITLGSEFKSSLMPEVKMPVNGTDPQVLIAGGGVLLSSLVQSCYQNNLRGFEFAVGIPGTLGGALFMNAGSAEDWIGSRVKTITVYKQDFGLRKYRAEELPWTYRSSGLSSDEIIVECELFAYRGLASEIRPKMEGALNIRKKTQPLTKPNAGSVFRNPADNKAGAMIEAVGMKGYQCGGAQVSDIHANFIINNGSAKAADVVAIIMEIRRRVKEQYGTELQPEIRFIGF